jgi:hypothetical protein
MFTNDKNVFDKVVAFRDAAIADSWNIEQTYKDQKHCKGEPVESASTLTRENFKMMILTRTENIGKWKYEVEITIWGDDELQIKRPEEYDWEKIKEGKKICDNCNVKNVKTFRYSFAGRCCEKCLPAMRAKYEHPGWCD